MKGYEKCKLRVPLMQPIYKILAIHINNLKIHPWHDLHKIAVQLNSFFIQCETSLISHEPLLQSILVAFFEYILNHRAFCLQIFSRRHNCPFFEHLYHYLQFGGCIKQVSIISLTGCHSSNTDMTDNTEPRENVYTINLIFLLEQRNHQHFIHGKQN